MRTRVVIGTCLVLVVLAMASLLPSGAQKIVQAQGQNEPARSGAPPLSNPLKVALLKWYRANVTTAFPVGVGPVGVAFDGANVWVASNTSGTVSKIRANDGASLGTFAVTDAFADCFDGANVWVTSNHLGDRPRGGEPLASRREDAGADNSVTKLRASDGKILGTFAVGASPGWPTFDGANIWVPNGGDNTVTKLRASDGKTLGTFAVGVGPIGTAFDGANIWVTNYTGLGNGTVTKLRASDGKVLGTFTVGEGPYGIAFDGAYIWVANANGGTITKLRASDGQTVGTFNLGGEAPTGVAFDGNDIWITGVQGVIELSPGDGQVLLYVPQPGNESGGVAFDGANVWVALTNAGEVGKL